jgi:hypothetical protein
LSRRCIQIISEDNILPHVQSLNNRDLIVAYTQELQELCKGFKAGKSLLRSAKAIAEDKPTA